MEQKNKKNFQIGLIIILGVLVFTLMAMLAYKKKPVILPTNNPKIEEPQNKPVDQISEEKKVEVDEIINITGKLTSVDISAIEVTPTEGDKITLKIPQKGANFFSQTKREDGVFVTKEIGLFDIPTNKEVAIQYNSTTNEVMMIEVK